MFGYAADDTLIGNAGADRMLGGPHGQETGQDTLDGGPGPDLLNGDSSEGGNSIDTVIYSDRTAGEPVNVTLGVGDGDDGGALDGPAGNRDTVIYVENVIGGAGNDVIKAFDVLQGDNNNFTNALFGGGGADLLLGGGGQDRLTGDKGRDILKGQGQKDHLFARDGTRDKKLDCGPGGRKESAQRDRIDPAPISC